MAVVSLQERIERINGSFFALQALKKQPSPKYNTPTKPLRLLLMRDFAKIRATFGSIRITSDVGVKVERLM